MMPSPAVNRLTDLPSHVIAHILHALPVKNPPPSSANKRESMLTRKHQFSLAWMSPERSAFSFPTEGEEAHPQEIGNLLLGLGRRDVVSEVMGSFVDMLTSLGNRPWWVDAAWMVRNLRRPMPEARRGSILAAVRATVDAYARCPEDDDKLWDLLSITYAAVRTGDVDALRVVLHVAGHQCAIPKSVDSFNEADPYTVGHLAIWCAYDARSCEAVLELLMGDLSHQRCEPAMSRAVRCALDIVGHSRNDGDAAHARVVDTMVR